MPLAPHSHNAATGRLFLQTHPVQSDITSVLPFSKVDNQILGVVVHAANIQDRDGAKLLLDRAAGRLKTVELIWADGGYAGALIDWLGYPSLMVFASIMFAIAAVVVSFVRRGDVKA